MTRRSNWSERGDEIARVTTALRRVLADAPTFSRVLLPRYRLRDYQIAPARAIVDSIEGGLGRQLAIVFSRQAGKDELVANEQVRQHLRVRHQRRGGSIVVAAPTFRPQAAISRDRLLDRLAGSRALGAARTRDGSIVHLGQASARFVSAAPGANARGQTADLLLVANEAQDIQPAVWDAVFDPMAASTNATTLFLGTVWSRETLLPRQLRYLEAEERRDGHGRVWRVAWEEVARELPAYGERVEARIAHLGIDHPFIQTEYFLRELDGEAGLFPPHRLAQMAGDHPRQHRATAGRRYALLLDVAGEEEAGGGAAAFDDASRRDSTALTIVEVGLAPPAPQFRGENDEIGGRGSEVGRFPAPGEGDQIPDTQPLTPSHRRPPTPDLRLPVYRVVDRMAWTGVRHTALHAQLVDLARGVWAASAVVVDATGVGAGLASFLAAALGDRRGGRVIPVLPFVFTQASKSALGWDFSA